MLSKDTAHTQWSTRSPSVLAVYTVTMIDSSFLSSDSNFKEVDAFIGFQKDTPASVVFQATNHLRAQKGCLETSQSNSEEMLEKEVCNNDINSA